MLSIGARIVAPELAEEILRIFLDTPFEGGRHQRRARRDRRDRSRRRDVDERARWSSTDPEIADIIEPRGRAPEHDDPADRVGELHVAARCSRRRARCSPTSTPRAIPAKRYYGGNLVVDEAEELARDRACALFGAEHANVQPHSGANANMAAYLALLEPGDKVMGMRLDQGGHLTHGSPVNFSGRIYDFVAYGVDDDDRDARLRRDPRRSRCASGRR